MVGAVVGDADIVWVHPKLLGYYLRRYGFRAIAPERGKQGDGHAARRPYPNARAFGRCRQAGGGGRIMKPEFGCAVGAALLARCQADTDVASLLACSLLFLPPGVQVNMLQSHIQHGWIVTAIVIVARGNVVGELLGLDEVLAAKFHTVNTQFIGGGIHQSLQYPVANIRAGAPEDRLLIFIG